MANGHPAAWTYPLSMVADETSFIVERENRRMANEAIVLRAAASAVLVQGGGEYFDKLINSLMGD